jgi:predicted metal-dependent peptidase
MKFFIVGLNLVDNNNSPTAAQSGIAPPEQLQQQTLGGKTWKYGGAGDDTALRKYALDTFIIYSPDAGARKSLKAEDLITFAMHDKLEGVTYNPNNATPAKDGTINAMEALNFTAAALYKLPCYLNGALIENPKRFVLGSIGYYYLAYDPVLTDDIEFMTKAELQEKAKEVKGRPWLPLSAERLTMDTLPARLKSKFIEKYSTAQARQEELSNLVSAKRDRDDASKELEEAKKLVERAAASGDEEKAGMARDILSTLMAQREEAESAVKKAEEEYKNSEFNVVKQISEDDIESAVSRENINLGTQFNLVDDDAIKIAPTAESVGSSIEESISLYGGISLRPRGGLKTVTQLLKEHEGELDEIYAEIDSQIEEDKAFGASLTFREVLYPGEDSSFEESSIAVSISKSTAGMPVRDVIISAADVLKTIDPYLWCVYNALKIVPVAADDPNANVCKTLGVTQTMMYYNIEFVKTLTMSELSFIMLHEMYHIIMKHPIRGKTYDPSLWNIVLDLFVNGTIAKNYGLDMGHKQVEYVGMRKDKQQTVRLTLPDSALFDPGLDVTTTIPEQMYVEMMEELQEKMRQLSGSQGNGQGQGQGQGNGQGQGQGQGNGQGQGQGSGQGMNQGGGSGSGNSQGSGQGNGRSGGNGPTNSGNRPIITDVKTGPNGKITSITVKMSNGQTKTVDASNNSDVFVEPGTLLENDDNKGVGINGVIERATQSARTAGLGDSSPAFRQVTNMQDIKDKNWEKFLEKYLRECHKTSKAYRRPNRKMMNYGYTMKGKVPTDPDSLKGVYICIDTSGSISDTDLNEMLGIIKATLQKYQITGHVLYWDTNVAAIGEFHDEKSLVAARRLAAGGGGTDPECVFRYLKSNACKEKANLVIMVTDGYFGRDIKKENPKRFGDVLWLITTGREDYLRFEPPFGKKAPLGFHWGKRN